MKNKRIRDYQNKELAESAIVDGKLLIRGTREWDDREILRAMNGCKVISWGARNVH